MLPDVTPIVKDSSSPGFQIRSVLDVRRTGRRFDYLVDFVDLPVFERAWIPLTDMPPTYNQLLVSFHDSKPRKPRPADSTINRTRALVPTTTPHGPIAHPLPSSTPATSDAPVVPQDPTIEFTSPSCRPRLIIHGPRQSSHK